MSSPPTPSGRRATRRDVAHRAGVSTTAVTAVLSGNCPNVSVSEATRQRILHAAEQLDYKPNLMARGLKTQRSLLLAYLCRSVYSRSHHVMLGMQAELEATGYSIVHYSRGDTLEAESRHLELCWDRGVDGILLTPMLAPDGRTNLKQLLKLVARGVPIVQLPNDTLPEVPSVMIDLRAAGRLTVEHLAALGHRRIVLLHPAMHIHAYDPAERSHPRELINGYRQAMEDAGLEPLALEHEPGATWDQIDKLLAGGTELAQRVLDHPTRPTAVIATHDHVAVALTRALNAMGRPAPESLSVVGMHNERSGRLSLPALTTVEVHHERLGCAAARLMLRQIQGHSITSEQIEPELIVRDSTAPPNDR